MWVIATCVSVDDLLLKLLSILLIEDLFIPFFTIAEECLEDDPVEVYYVTLNLLELLVASVVLLEHLEVFPLELGRNPLVMRDVLIYLHHHLVVLHVRYPHVVRETGDRHLHD